MNSNKKLELDITTHNLHKLTRSITKTITLLTHQCNILKAELKQLQSHQGNTSKFQNRQTKKTKIGKSSKANHFSYLGDAEIGKEVNIGAGTITCNYDGKDKHKTKIGDASFIGTNSSLVAPVNIGKNAYVGAGSTITKDIPDNALGVGRGKQNNKDNWSKNKK